MKVATIFLNFLLKMRSVLCCSLLVILCIGITSCSTLTPILEQPTLKVVGLQLLPAQGFSQPIQVSLLIANPNDRDLSLRGMSYAIGIENFEVLSGVSDQVPTLSAYKETPVNVVVTANILQLVGLIQSLKGKNKESIAYNFSAKLDFSAWLPALNVNEKGLIPLVKNK